MIRKIEQAAKFCSIEQLAISPQCGFGGSADNHFMTVEEQWTKLENMVEPRDASGDNRSAVVGNSEYGRLEFSALLVPTSSIVTPSTQSTPVAFALDGFLPHGLAFAKSKPGGVTK